jgi:hypothetical protein
VSARGVFPGATVQTASPNEKIPSTVWHFPRRRLSAHRTIHGPLPQTFERNARWTTNALSHQAYLHSAGRVTQSGNRNLLHIPRRAVAKNAANAGIGFDRDCASFIHRCIFLRAEAFKLGHSTFTLGHVRNSRWHVVSSLQYFTYGLMPCIWEGKAQTPGAGV